MSGPHIALPIKTVAQRVAKRHADDNFFIGMARYISRRSKDPSTKVGAVLTDDKGIVVGMGYNGFPRKMRDDPELYADRETKYSRIIHAEMNAILNAGRSVEGCTLYTSKLPPCDRCAVFVVQAGIARVVFEEPSEELLARWGDALGKTFAIFEEAGVAYAAHSYSE